MPRIAVAQTPGARLDRWQETLELLPALVRRGAAAGAAIVVLPECVWPAYHIGSKRAYFAARQRGLPDHRHFLEKLSVWARDTRVIICAGFIEEQGDRLFNTACVVNAAGEPLGSHRKCFLWDFDHDWFEPGRTIQPLDTELGRVGVMICADARLPEIPATLAHRGARLITQPTAWVNVGDAERLWNPQPDFLIPTRAREFGLPIASASKCGTEGDTTFVGSSLICDATGRILAQCGTRETAVISADVELAPPAPLRPSAQDRTVLLAPRPLRLRLTVYPPGLPREARATGGEPQGPAGPVLEVYPGDPPEHGARHWRRRRHDVATLAGATRSVHFMQGVGIAGVSDAAARTFAAIRARVLCGAQVVVVFGERVNPAVIRTRAAENRVFVVAAGQAGATVYDPGGRSLATRSWAGSAGSAAPDGALALALDVWRATDKLVAPRTDIVAGRTPSQYAF